MECDSLCGIEIIDGTYTPKLGDNLACVNGEITYLGDIVAPTVTGGVEESPYDECCSSVQETFSGCLVRPEPSCVDLGQLGSAPSQSEEFAGNLGGAIRVSPGGSHTISETVAVLMEAPPCNSQHSSYGVRIKGSITGIQFGSGVVNGLLTLLYNDTPTSAATSYHFTGGVAPITLRLQIPEQIIWLPNNYVTSLVEKKVSIRVTNGADASTDLYLYNYALSLGCTRLLGQRCY